MYLHFHIQNGSLLEWPLKVRAFLAVSGITGQRMIVDIKLMNVKENGIHLMAQRVLLLVRLLCKWPKIEAI